MKFEYKTLKFATASAAFSGGDVKTEELDKALNALGSEGWELVSALDTNVGAGVSKYIIAIFKRVV